MYGNHFTFEELVTTSTGLYNIPVVDNHLANLASLWNFLNYLREELGHPIYVNSAYRSEMVNKQVGGAKRSLHMQGRAADIRCAPEHMPELKRLLVKETLNLSEVIFHETYYHIAL